MAREKGEDMMIWLMETDGNKAVAGVMKAAAKAMSDWSTFTTQASMTPARLVSSLVENPNSPTQFDTRPAVDLVEAAVRAQRSTLQVWTELFQMSAGVPMPRMETTPFGLTGLFTTEPPRHAPRPAPAPKPRPAAPKAAAAEAPNPAPAKPAKAKTTKASKTDIIAELLREPQVEPDDLTQIKGIGPKLSQALHELGIFYYRQIAALTDEEIAAINDRLRFKGRIERERWVEQAKNLSES